MVTVNSEGGGDNTQLYESGFSFCFETKNFNKKRIFTMNSIRKKMFLSPLFFLTLLAALPLWAQPVKTDEYRVAENIDKSYLHLDENWNEFIEFMARVSEFDEDETSPIHMMNNQIANGNDIVLKEAVLKAFCTCQIGII